MGSGEEFIIGKSWTGYRHFEESTLDAIFEKYKLGSEDETKLKKLVKSIMKGKVKPTNVACFALGSFHRLYNEPKRSFEQFAVLLKLMEILGKSVRILVDRNRDANTIHRNFTKCQERNARSRIFTRRCKILCKVWI